MNETLILAIIAVAAAVLLLGMPFWLFGKRKNAVCVPAPVPGEEHRPATAEEIAVLRKMVTDLFSGPVVNDGDRRCVREAIALWQPGTSFAKLIVISFMIIFAKCAILWKKLPKCADLTARWRKTPAFAASAMPVFWRL